MQLRRLRVRNIRSYVAATLEVPPGTTLLSGDVGAGKTSLLYAVEMALFGVAEVDAAYLVRHGSGVAEVEVEFEGDGHRYAVSRRFRRVHRRGKETFEPERITFRVDGQPTAYSATELRQRVIELLGFPDNPNPQAHSDLWRWAVYVPQERMRDILSARPQERLETVRKALGVERYRTAAENAQEFASDLRRSASALRSEAERLRHFDLEFSEATAELDRLHADGLRLDASISAKLAVVQEAEQRLTAAESGLRRTEADRRELESLGREQDADARVLADLVRRSQELVREVDGKRREAETSRSEAASSEADRDRLRGVEGRVRALRGELDLRNERLRELARARADVAAQARRAEEARRRVGQARVDGATAGRAAEAVRAEGPSREPPAPTPRSLEEIDRGLSAAREAEASNRSALAEAQRNFEEVEELLSAGVCPRCGQSVRREDFATHRSEAGASVEKLRAEHERSVVARESLEAERRARERFERARDRWSELEKRRSMTRSAADRAEAALREAQDEEHAAESALAEAREHARALEPVEAEATRLRQELEGAELERLGATEAVDRASRAAERLRSAMAAIAPLEAEADRLAGDRRAATERSDSRRARIDELAARVRRADELAREHAAAEAGRATAVRELEAERMVRARVEARSEEGVRRLRVAERGRAERAAVLADASDLEAKSEWTGGPFRTALLAMEQKLLSHAQSAFERYFARYFASLVDDPGLVAQTDPTFTPAVRIEGEWTPAEALSGGERTSLALAFRLALSQVVRSMGSVRLESILLDEPTDGFSPEQVVRMGELLDELALPQVVVVSHESGLAAIADRVVRVEKRDGRSVLVGPTGSPSAEAGPALAPGESDEVVPARRGRGRRRATS